MYSKLVTTLLALLLCNAAMAQTAKDFTANDCSGKSHNFFKALDSGKVVVLAWVMPCNACSKHALAAYNEIKNIEINNPGKVKFYLVDDFANTTCTALAAWASSNGITNPDAVFSNSAIKMSDYGSAGMPKIVVAAGTSHKVYFNQNNTLDVAKFKEALNNSITEVSSVQETNKKEIDVTVTPNVINKGKVTINFDIATASDISIDIFDASGKKIETIVNNEKLVGKQNIIFDPNSLEQGLYFVSINSKDYASTVKFQVVR